MIIPDEINASLGVSGLTFQMTQSLNDCLASLFFAFCIVGFFWSIRWLYARLMHQTGLGLGDVKLMGVSALWLSPWNFPAFLFLACAFALLYYAATHQRHGNIRLVKVPFGPFLALSLLITWNIDRLYGPLTGSFS